MQHSSVLHRALSKAHEPLCSPASRDRRSAFRCSCKASAPTCDTKVFSLPNLDGRRLHVQHSRKRVRISSAVSTEQPVEPVKAFDIEAKTGVPYPLGPSLVDKEQQSVNFAVFSQHAKKVTLVLLSSDQSSHVEVPLIPSEGHRTDNIWHATVEGLPLSGVLYGYKVEGEGDWSTGHRWDASKVLLDPYAPLVKGRAKFGERDSFENFQQKAGSTFLGTYDFESEPFDWGEDYSRPNIPFQDLVIYEMPVRSFTADENSGVPSENQGTFLGVADKVEHLSELGITAVELLPVFEYDELEFRRTPNPREHMINIWGYSHINFMAPMSRFAAGGAGPAAAAREFKQMVKTLHAAGIEVILDVVYNHTAEGGDDDPYLLSFRGFDNSVYYMLDMHGPQQLLNYSGCGNTVSGNHPVVKQLILDSLRWWVEEYHVDGFRFDLASALTRDERGVPLPAPPLIHDIAKDPVLSKVKLIAEPWDCGGLYQVGSFPNWDIWAEWNGKFRDDIRRFIKGDAGMKKGFATRLAGSSDLYHVNNRKPYHSINFVIAHDGFTLYDLVAYDQKRNHDNGEGNRDGTNDNFSWCCGVEGPTDDPGVNALRQRQMRNLMVALMVSQGTPMVLSGDEYGQTRWGNNNSYGFDNKMTRFNWEELEGAKEGFFRFLSCLIKFRRECPLLGRADFMSPEDVTWHEGNWNNDESRFLAFTLHDRSGSGADLYLAFNAHAYEITITLPGPPGGKKWSRLVDTNLQPPRDFTPGGNSGVDPVYTIVGFSAIMLLAKDA